VTQVRQVTQSLVRVIVHYREPAGSSGAVVAAYRAARATMQGVPGLVGHELLGAQEDDGRFALLMTWRDMTAFEEWERRLRATGHPSPLRPYQDRERPGGHYEVYRLHEDG
jgi:hypothetical protein